MILLNTPLNIIKFPIKAKQDDDDEFSGGMMKIKSGDNKSKYWFTGIKWIKFLKFNSYLNSLPEMGKVFIFGSEFQKLQRFEWEGVTKLRNSLLSTAKFR